MPLDDALPTMTDMPPDRRLNPREPLELPMSLADGTPARTRNVSADGLYFTMPRGTSLDHWVYVEFAVPAAGLKFTAAGEVVRIDRAMNDYDGAALRLHAPRLVATD